MNLKLDPESPLIHKKDSKINIQIKDKVFGNNRNRTLIQTSNKIYEGDENVKSDHKSQ